MHEVLACKKRQPKTICTWQFLRTIYWFVACQCRELSFSAKTRQSTVWDTPLWKLILEKPGRGRWDSRIENWNAPLFASTWFSHTMGSKDKFLGGHKKLKKLFKPYEIPVLCMHVVPCFSARWQPRDHDFSLANQTQRWVTRHPQKIQSSCIRERIWLKTGPL